MYDTSFSFVILRRVWSVRHGALVVQTEPSRRLFGKNDNVRPLEIWDGYPIDGAVEKNLRIQGTVGRRECGDYSHFLAKLTHTLCQFTSKESLLSTKDRDWYGE